ncbi:MAG: response regulator transcription factor [Bacteroidetes bacterium]|nr:response regulator transcription factor [Bacteroidota bacterium]
MADINTGGDTLMDSKIKIAVVDDQHLVREGIISLLKEYEGFEIILEASNGHEFVELLQDRKPQVVLLDYEMPVMDGNETIQVLQKQYPDIKIIVISGYDTEELMIHLMERGVNAFLQKDRHANELIDAIHVVMNNNYYFNNRISMVMLRRLVNMKKHSAVSDPISLTEREIEVAKLVCQELSNKEIAEKLFLSPRTIDSYREKLMQKIGARNTAGIVLYAIKHNLLD